MTAQPEQTFLADPETGEILHEIGPVPERFEVHDDASAEWVMKKLSEIDAELQSIENRKAALLANFDLMARPLAKARDGLLWRFKSELEQYAKAHLPHGRKSWACPYGSVQFRATKPHWKVTDPTKAALSLWDSSPEAVRVTVELSELGPRDRTAVMGYVEAGSAEAKVLITKAQVGDRTDGLEYVSASESCAIKTGVGE